MSTELSKPQPVSREFELEKHSWRGVYPRSMVLPGDGTLLTLDNSRVTNQWPLSSIVNVIVETEGQMFTLVLESSLVCGTPAKLKFSFRRALDDNCQLFQALSDANVPVQLCVAEESSRGQAVAPTESEQDQTAPVVSASDALSCVECGFDSEEAPDEILIRDDVDLVNRRQSLPGDVAGDDVADRAEVAYDLDVPKSVYGQDDGAATAYNPTESRTAESPSIAENSIAGSPSGESRPHESPSGLDGSLHADSPTSVPFESAVVSPLQPRAASPDQEASLYATSHAESQPPIQMPPPVEVEPPASARAITPQAVLGRRLPTPMAVASGARTPGSVTVPPSPQTPAIMQAVARMRAAFAAQLTVRQLHDHLVTEGGPLSKAKLSKVKKASSKLKRQALAAGAVRAGVCGVIAPQEPLNKENASLLDMLNGSPSGWFSTLGLTRG